MIGSRYLALAVVGVLLGGMVAAACGGDTNDDGLFGGKGGTGAQQEASMGGTGSGTTGGSGGGLDAGSDQSTGGTLNADGSTVDAIEAGSSCDLQKYDTPLVVKPVDIIFAVDNSCSMAEEMYGIQVNINTNFAQIIGSSGVDYRVILIGEHGGYNYPSSYESSICIDPPLSGAPCATPLLPDTAPTNNPPIFYHYDNNDIESNDMWSKMLAWYDEPDRYNLLPSGWKGVLRADAFKFIVGFSDDRIYDYTPVGGFSFDDGIDAPGAQSVALEFDTAITTLDATQFGTPTNRKYRYHAIVGVTENLAATTGGYLPSDPLVKVDCPSAVNVGWGHQGLALLTGGSRFPVCEGQNFAVAFQEIAKDVIRGAIACEFPMPDPPSGKELDPSTITLDYTPSGSGSATTFDQVADETHCVPDAFYIDGTQLKLCPDACSLVGSDPKASLQILALCTSN